MIRTAIIGCGLIGQKRAKSLGASSLAMCCDHNPQRAAALASKYSGAKATVHWEEAIVHPDVDVVIVSTSHDALAVIAERRNGRIGARRHGQGAVVEDGAATLLAVVGQPIEFKVTSAVVNGGLTNDMFK